VTILIDSGNTHNFIHWKVAENTHCYVHVVHNFQIMIANGGMMKCGGKCDNLKLHVVDYQLKSHMFTIEMGGYHVVLIEKWL
jgi:hypothetical protein